MRISELIDQLYEAAGTAGADAEVRFSLGVGGGLHTPVLGVTVEAEDEAGLAKFVVLS